MAAKIVTVSPEMIWTPERLQRLWFFPDGSEYLRYAPHFHAIYPGGFRTNLPLNHMFVVVLEGKLSVKDYYGETTTKIEVQDQVWYFRGSSRPAKHVYASVRQPRCDLLGRSHFRTKKRHEAAKRAAREKYSLE